MRRTQLVEDRESVLAGKNDVQEQQVRRHGAGHVDTSSSSVGLATVSTPISLVSFLEVDLSQFCAREMAEARPLFTPRRRHPLGIEPSARAGLIASAGRCLTPRALLTRQAKPGGPEVTVDLQGIPRRRVPTIVHALIGDDVNQAAPCALEHVFGCFDGDVDGPGLLRG